MQLKDRGRLILKAGVKMNIDVSDFNALIQKVWNYPQIDDNKTKIKKYVDRFNELVEKYKNE